MYQLVRDRALAKQLYKKGSLIEQVLKTLVNTLYGKVAQGVVQKRTWSARSDEMVDIGYSAITSPCTAAIITGGVRAFLLAAMNQLTQKGYHVYSVTTDGFISDAPSEVLYQMDLFGFAEYFKDARKFLTDGEDDSMWEIKHEQYDLLNITTRGNVSLNHGNTDLEYAGVCAHNAWQSGEKVDTYEDRIAYMTSVLSRQGSLICKEQRWLGYKEMVRQRLDFSVSEVDRKVSMDFDMKRCPMYESGKTVYPEINNTSYEIFNFDTRPFNNIDEYIKYRDCKKHCKVLRIQQDWELFFAKLEVKEAGTCQHIKDLEWSKLFSVIMGYRIGLWDIPALGELKSVAKKIEWINTHNHSSKKFTQNDWKNARRQERATQILPREMLFELFVEMGVVV